MQRPSYIIDILPISPQKNQVLFSFNDDTDWDLDGAGLTPLTANKDGSVFNFETNSVVSQKRL